MNKISSGSSTTIVFWTRKLSLSILLFGCVCSPSYGQSKATESPVEIVGSPLVNNEQVTIRIKVKDADEKPVTALEYNNFQLWVDEKQVNFRQRDWTSPQTAWIIFLLDLSGSMDNNDKSGKRKLDGAIDAIREFTTDLAGRGGETNVNIAIVPFGKRGEGCSEDYPVRETELNNFLSPNDPNLGTFLDKLASKKPCAATNIYESLTKAINFLGNSKDKPFYVEKDSNKPQPRLAVVLLSDGYDSVSIKPEDEKIRFQNLISLLKKQNGITVHTLGYGLTPKELEDKYNLKRPATRTDIFKDKGKVPPDKVPEAEFVDQDRLAEIAKVTGGIAEFSPDAEAVAKKLKGIVDALLSEYKITYTQTNAERGSSHNVSVIVNSPNISSPNSDSKSYRMDTFGRSLPLPVRLQMLVIVFILLIVGGVIPFWLWGRALKREALET